MKEVTKNGITLVFYQKQNDKKYSFLIKDDEELTSRLLGSVKKKRIDENEFVRARSAIFEKIENNFVN